MIFILLFTKAFQIDYGLKKKGTLKFYFKKNFSFSQFYLKWKYFTWFLLQNDFDKFYVIQFYLRKKTIYNFSYLQIYLKIWFL